MSCIAELSYLRFNPLFPDQSQKTNFLESIKKLTNENNKLALTKLIGLVGYDHTKETADLVDNLTLLSLELKETFDRNGT